MENESKKRICFWVDSVMTVGGVQRVTSVVASELSKYYDITIICTDNDKSIIGNIYNVSDSITIKKEPESFSYKNRPFIYKVFSRCNRYFGLFNIKILNNLGLEIYFPKKKRNKIVEYFNCNNFDLIIGVQGDKSVLLGSVANKLNSKTWGWQHNSYEAYFENKNRYYWNQDFLFKNTLSNLDRYMVLNEYDAKKVKDNFNIQTDYIYNPKSFTSTLKSDMENKMCLAAGRFVYAKGFDILIDAVNEFTKDNPDWKVYLVGDGEDQEMIDKKIKEYNLEETVILTGYTDDIRKYFLKSSVFLLTSRWEGMPMIVLEALEMGTPIISFDITAIKPLVSDGIEGLVVKKEDGYRGFANSMNILANDKGLRKEMSKNALKKSKSFEIETVISRWTTYIEKDI